MATEKQVAANRQNAHNSTGPRTEAGKRRSRRNALRHGLTAETVVELHEDAGAYRALQRAINTDYRPTTNFESELIARLVSLLWRLRRATAIESGLLNIHAQPKNGKNPGDLEIFYSLVPSLTPRAASISAGSNESIESKNNSDAIARAFSRLGHLEGKVFERLCRYETSVWRQTLQTILLLNSISHHVDERPEISSRYLGLRKRKGSQYCRWPPIRPFSYD